MNKNQNIGLLIIRLSIGLLMLLHGISKLLHGIDGISQMVTNLGLPQFLSYGVFIGEIVMPLLIIIGFRTRLASIIFVFNMLTAFLLVHTPDLFKLTPQGGWAIELLALYLFGALALFFTGAGKYAVSSSSKWD